MVTTGDRPRLLLLLHNLLLLVLLLLPLPISSFPSLFRCCVCFLCHANIMYALSGFPSFVFCSSSKLCRMGINGDLYPSVSPPFSSFLSVFDCLTFFPLLYNNLSIQSRVPAGWKLLVIILIPIFLSPFIFLFYSFRCLTHSYPRYLFLTHLSHPSSTFCPRLASFTRHPPPKRAVSHPSGSFQI